MFKTGCKGDLLPIMCLCVKRDNMKVTIEGKRTTKTTTKCCQPISKQRYGEWIEGVGVLLCSSVLVCPI